MAKVEEIVSGALVFTGTRVPVDILIDYLRAGDSLDRFLEVFPIVAREQAEGFLEIALEAGKAEMDEVHPAWRKCGDSHASTKQRL